MKKIYKLFTMALITIGVQSANSQCVTPTMVTASPSVICAGATTSLNAIALGSSINWYTVPVAGVPIGTSLSGADFTVNPTSNVTFYAESFLTGTQTYTYTGVIQNYTVPAGVNQVTITAKGAQGGNAPPLTGGLGASMSGIFTVTPGQVFSILVGQTPGANDNGGGGGSFVVLNGPNTPYIIAGGGGGAAGPCCAAQQAGMPGVITTSGTIGANVACVSGTAGINGNGGGGGDLINLGAGGGGGFLTNGGSGVLAANNGKSFLNGGAGGVGVKGTTNIPSSGGFGGGGGPHDNAGWAHGSGGGGGGYSGGGGTVETQTGVMAAGAALIT